MNLNYEQMDVQASRDERFKAVLNAVSDNRDSRGSIYVYRPDEHSVNQMLLLTPVRM